MQELDRLNDKQRQAVISGSKQLLILAGAGTGKTSTLTQKIAYLIKEKGVNPYNILAITFTNKAAEEMRLRVKGAVGEDANDMWIFTFHSACMRILRRYIDRLGYKNTFVVYDTEDKLSLINRIMKELNIGDNIKKKYVAGEISNAKLLGMDPVDYDRSIDSFDYIKRTVGQIYSIYQQEIKEANAVDFDDLIKLTVELFDKNEDIRDYYSERFKYIFVDEYQDTNMQQFKLVEQLARNHKNLCVVGDDDQSIYKFRGADIGNILGFEKVYPNAEVIKLEQNYRSTKNILNAANLIIANNKNRKSKKLWTENIEGDKVVVYDFNNEYEEAKSVVSKIEYMYTMQQFDYKDITILYRTNSQSRTFEEFMVKSNIPYKILGGINFYQRKEIKDILAYLKIIVNSSDTTSLRRIINVPKRGIGETTIQKLNDFAMINNINLYEAMKCVDNMGTITASTKKKINEFVDLIEDLKKQLSTYSVSNLIENLISDTGYIMSFSSQEEMIDRQENLKELINKAVFFEESDYEDKTLVGFLQDISLFTDMDDTDYTDNRVTLMTVHCAKGLEFPCVFLVGMEDGLFPFYLAQQESGESGIEEERRLCYVAITRAEKLLNITWSRSRRGKFSGKSIFIKEFEENFTYRPKVEKVEKLFSNVKVTSNYNKKVILNRESFKIKESSELEFEEGDRVKHRKFGEGVVKEIFKNSEGMTTVKVDFEKSGEKDMVAAFAKLTKV